MPTLATFFSADTVPSLDVEGRLAQLQDETVLSAADSARIAREDSILFYEKLLRHGKAHVFLPDSDLTFFFPLFDALAQSRSRLVHVMHYGDSQIEADRITSVLRSHLQSQFGGSGPGLIPLQQPIPARSVAQSLSDSIDMRYAGGIMGARASHNRYGAMAQVAQLRTGADTLRLSVSPREVGGFKRVTVFARGDSLLSVSISGERHYFTKSMSSEEWTTATPRSLSAMFSGRGEVYGVAIDGGYGVSVSNVPMRGSDGLFISRLDAAIASSMLRALNTSLVILEFGGNALPVINKEADVYRYCRGFALQIAAVRRMLPPSARILVIGPADMSVKQDGVLQTHPMLPYLVEQMRRASNEAGAAFWDMYQVMGGYNSMLAWVDHKPAWAAPDYIHFTVRGSEKIADVLWQSIMTNYQYYLLLQKRQQEMPSIVPPFALAQPDDAQHF